MWILLAHLVFVDKCIRQPTTMVAACQCHDQHQWFQVPNLFKTCFAILTRRSVKNSRVHSLLIRSMGFKIRIWIRNASKRIAPAHEKQRFDFIYVWSQCFCTYSTAILPRGPRKCVTHASRPPTASAPSLHGTSWFGPTTWACWLSRQNWSQSQH